MIVTRFTVKTFVRVNKTADGNTDSGAKAKCAEQIISVEICVEFTTN